MTKDQKIKTEDQRKAAGKKELAAGDNQRVATGKESALKAKKSLSRDKKKGVRYLRVKKLVDPHRSYSIKEAISLLKKTASASFEETAEAHLVLKQDNFSAQVNFPHDRGKKRVIAIADDEKVMAQIKSGKIDFDVLLASPKTMSKLVPYARILGPRGLMPNPKEGTVTADPEKKAQELAGAGVRIRTEKKAPLVHTVFGRTGQKETELEANLEALLKSVGRQNIRKLVIASTMGPGIAVGLD